MNKLSRVGIDLAKNVFQLHGVDRHGKAVWRRRLTRDKWLKVFTGSASLTATQNGVTVYNEVEDLNVPVSQRAGIKFPAFEPTASSIAWFSCTEFFSNGHCVCEVVMDIDHRSVVDVNPD